MATGKQIEDLTGYLARETPKRDRQSVLSGLNNVGTGLDGLIAVKTLLDTVVADAATAGQDDYTLAQVQAGWAGNLTSVVATDFGYSGKTGINALAQLLADLSEQAGLEGGPNRLRLFKGQPGSETIVPVDQDA